MLIVAVLAALLLLGLFVWSWRDRAFTTTARVAEAHDLSLIPTLRRPPTYLVRAKRVS